jgi:hypothetical protein
MHKIVLRVLLVHLLVFRFHLGGCLDGVDAPYLLVGVQAEIWPTGTHVYGVEASEEPKKVG